MKILLIDNYDSFTFNLVHYLEGFDAEVTVMQNDRIEFSQLTGYDKLVLSPGPGLPETSGDLMKVIEWSIDRMPVLGVCLGFQAIVLHYGGKLYNQNEVKHGVSEDCTIVSDTRLFKGINHAIQVGLYHSWAAERKSFPSCLKITGELKDQTIMAFEHESLPAVGVQFHPESILTEEGKKIIQNFLFNF